MVVRLIPDVVFHGLDVGLAYQEGPVARLPEKALDSRPLVFIHLELLFFTSSTIVLRAWFFDSKKKA